MEYGVTFAMNKQGRYCTGRDGLLSLDMAFVSGLDKEGSYPAEPSKPDPEHPEISAFNGANRSGSDLGDGADAKSHILA